MLFFLLFALILTTRTADVGIWEDALPKHQKNTH